MFMKVLFVILAITILSAFIYVAFDMAKNRKKIQLINIVGIIIIPYLFPFIYLVFTERTIKN